MRFSSSSSSDQSPAMSSHTVGFRDAESLFRTKPVSEIRIAEAQTRKQIDDKKEELRQLIGNRYRDLIDSADSILVMKSSCESISLNVNLIYDRLFSLNCVDDDDDVVDDVFGPSLNRSRVRIYGIACRVKYLVDTPENIWGCLDEFMFLEASARYVRSKLVYVGLKSGGGDELRRNFPLLNHQWQIVESFKGQISQRSREKLMVVDTRAGYDVLKVDVGAFADALAGVAVIDELDPRQVFGLFLESRKGWILQRLSGFDGGSSGVVSVFCDVLRIIQVTVAQVGEMFLQVLSDMPLFYKVILGSPPASQLFGGIPNPDEEERLWNEFREKLESVMVNLDRDFVAKSCCSWLRECGREIVKKVNGRCLIDSIANGAELASAEKLLRETMDSKEVLEGSLEWLKSVFGSDIELPWSRTRELVLDENVDLWDEIFEDAFVSRMKLIIGSAFEDLNRTVNVSESISSIGGNFSDQSDFRAYLHRSSADGGVWFVDPNVKKPGLVSNVKALPEEFDFGSCLGAYFGPEASRIRDEVDSCCRGVMEDLLSFLDSPKASLRLNRLVPYLHDICYESMSTILNDLKNELDKLRTSLEKANKKIVSQPPAAIIEKSLFIGRLLFAFQNHLKYVPVVLGSPRYWVNETLVSSSDKLLSFLRQSRYSLDSVAPDISGKHLGNSRRQSLVANALFGATDTASPKLEEVISSIRDLCIAAHGLWISWVSDELANILSEDLRRDDGLSATTPLRGWEEVVVKQDPSSGSDSEMKILLPSLPSLYIASFLFSACEEVHRVGGHVLDKVILQRFAKNLLEKVIDIYSDLATNGVDLSEKGVLQVLLDLRFAADILSGCDSTSTNEALSNSMSTKSSFRRKQEKSRSKSVIQERVDDLVNRFSQKLDPIDWQTFQPYLLENERQSYLRHAVLFGFFVQLNRLYTDTVQKLPTNAESNIMRCSTVPRFKYLPISAPALSSRATTKAPIRTSSDDVSSRSSLAAYANGEFSQKIDFDDNSSFGAATPFLKSFMQVGSRFGEGTFKLGSILNDARFKDKTAAMPSFGDILPVQAAGLLSSFTTTRSDS